MQMLRANLDETPNYRINRRLDQSLGFNYGSEWIVAAAILGPNTRHNGLLLSCQFVVDSVTRIRIFGNGFNDEAP